ncbi:MAG: hypothetical protein ACI9C1_001553 [Candidatus Aldehydirespiratoraceae bacterium]|jgi:hypothetical protein
MHACAASIRHLTGLNTYTTAILTVMVLHVITMIGISALSCGFCGFNTIFAHESFAIVLCVWSCVARVHLQMSAPIAWVRTAWLIVGIHARWCPSLVELREPDRARLVRSSVRILGPRPQGTLRELL